MNLENREGGEIDDLRKSKVELEVRIAELEEVENNAKEREARFKAKLQKYKDSLAEHTVRICPSPRRMFCLKETSCRKL